MSPSADALRRRVERLDSGGEQKIYWVTTDETDKYRLPDGPEEAAEIATILAIDPHAHIIRETIVDGRISHEESAVRVAALLAERLAEERPT